MSFKVVDEDHFFKINYEQQTKADILVPHTKDYISFDNHLSFGGSVHAESSITTRQNITIDVAKSSGYHKLIMDPGDVFDIDLTCSDTYVGPQGEKNYFGITIVIENYAGSGGAINWSPNIHWTGGYPYLDDDEHVVVAITTPDGGGIFYGAQAYPKYDYPFPLPAPPKDWYGYMWDWTVPFVGYQTSVQTGILTDTTRFSGWEAYGDPGEDLIMYGENTSQYVHQFSSIQLFATDGTLIQELVVHREGKGDWTWNISDQIRKSSRKPGYIYYQTRVGPSAGNSGVLIKGLYDNKRSRWLDAAEMAPP